MVKIFGALFAFTLLFCLLYIVTVRMYWSGRFAVYRLVSFVRSRKHNG